MLLAGRRTSFSRRWSVFFFSSDLSSFFSSFYSIIYYYYYIFLIINCVVVLCMCSWSSRVFNKNIFLLINNKKILVLYIIPAAVIDNN